MRQLRAENSGKHWFFHRKRASTATQLMTEARGVGFAPANSPLYLGRLPKFFPPPPFHCLLSVSLENFPKFFRLSRPLLHPVSVLSPPSCFGKLGNWWIDVLTLSVVAVRTSCCVRIWREVEFPLEFPQREVQFPFQFPLQFPLSFFGSVEVVHQRCRNGVGTV